MLSRYTVDANQYKEADYPAYDARQDRRKEGVLFYIGISGGIHEIKLFAEEEGILGSIRIDDQQEETREVREKASREFTQACHELSKRKLQEYEGVYATVNLSLDKGVYLVETTVGYDRYRPGGDVSRSEETRSIDPFVAMECYLMDRARAIRVDALDRENGGVPGVYLGGRRGEQKAIVDIPKERSDEKLEEYIGERGVVTLAWQDGEYLAQKRIAEGNEFKKEELKAISLMVAWRAYVEMRENLIRLDWGEPELVTEKLAEHEGITKHIELVSRDGEQYIITSQDRGTEFERVGEVKQGSLGGGWKEFISLKDRMLGRDAKAMQAGNQNKEVVLEECRGAVTEVALVQKGDKFNVRTRTEIGTVNEWNDELLFVDVAAARQYYSFYEDSIRALESAERVKQETGAVTVRQSQGMER